jgi:excisionase family DNA binding protein
MSKITSTRDVLVHAEMSRDSSNEFLSRKQAARLLVCSDQLISKLVKNKKLRAFKLGRKVIILRSDLVSVLKECK